MIRVLTTRSLSITLDGIAESVQLQDGRWQVKAKPTGVQVLNVTTTDGTSGSVINSPGKGARDVQTQSAVGQIMRPGDVLLAASTVQGGTQCDEMTAVHVVPDFDVLGNPWPMLPDMLAGPALGRRNPLVDFLRTAFPIMGDRVNAAKLPSVVDVESLPVQWAAFGKGRPTFEWLESKFNFIGDVGDMWGVTGTPVSQVEAYGRQFASRVSTALVMLCSTAPAEAKQRLAVRLVQAGIDLLGAFLDGREQESDGGWYMGRKACVVFALEALGIPKHLWPFALRGQFQEDLAYADVGPWQWGDTPGWRFAWRGRHRERFWLHLPPNQWTTSGGEGGRNEVYYTSSYLYANVGSQVGTALAMRLLGLTHWMGAAFDGFVAQWMTQPTPPGVVAGMQSRGIALPWGSDYSTDRAQDFCAAAWRKYVI